MNNRPQQALQLMHPSPEQVTSEQVDNVLSVLAELHHFLFPPPSSFDSIPKDAPRLDGEAAIAATTTFIKACSKLDAILDDESRWTIAPLKQIYAAINLSYAQQFEFLKAQTLAANAISRPMFLMKPDLAKLEDGSFIAYWGDVATPGAGLIGRGKTPADAFADFDAAYFRQDQIKIEPPADEQPKKPRKKK